MYASHSSVCAAAYSDAEMRRRRRSGESLLLGRPRALAAEVEIVEEVVLEGRVRSGRCEGLVRRRPAMQRELVASHAPGLLRRVVIGVIDESVGQVLVVGEKQIVEAAVVSDVDGEERVLSMDALLPLRL